MKSNHNPKIQLKYLQLEKKDCTKRPVTVSIYPFVRDTDTKGYSSNGERLRNLLGAGYTIVKNGGGSRSGKKKPQKKDPQNKVGGKNPIQKEENKGKRGTRKRGKGKPKQVVVSMKPAGNGQCLTPYEMKKPSRENIEKAREAKESFARLVGFSENKITSPPRINVFELTMALELGTDPIAPLEFRHEDKALPKIGIVVDNSGSCHAFSGAARCMGDAIIEACDVEVTVGINDIPNFDIRQDYREYQNGVDLFVTYLHTCDVIIYLGDEDGWYGGEGGVPYFASKGIKVIALSNKSCNYGEPKICSPLSIPNVAWVQRTDLSDIKVIVEGIDLAISHLQ